MSGGRLRELCVGLDEAGGFCWVEAQAAAPPLAEHFERVGVSLAEGHFAEVNLAAGEWIERAAAVLRSGYVVTVDYGAEAEELYRSPQRRDGTLRGFREHRFVPDVLAAPGEHDLTTTINWTQVRRAGEAAGLETITFERQDEFLLRAGLLAQLEQLTMRAATEAERLRLRLGAREMILPGGMSGSFQVLVQKKTAA
jgi:SAM-dependent MidA family methyltransferase